MRSESNAHQYSPAALADSIAPRSPWRVTRVEAQPGFRLGVTFTDGLAGTVDMNGLFIRGLPAFLRYSPIRLCSAR